MRLITRLNPIEYDAVLQLAQRERRDPRDQAALIIRRELERLGLIEPEVKHAETSMA